jgi:hypothetical protein
MRLILADPGLAGQQSAPHRHIVVWLRGLGGYDTVHGDPAVAQLSYDFLGPVLFRLAHREEDVVLDAHRARGVEADVIVQDVEQVSVADCFLEVVHFHGWFLLCGYTYRLTILLYHIPKVLSTPLVVL